MKRSFIILLILALAVSASAQSNWSGFFIGGTATFSNDGSAQELKDNLAPQFSAVIKLGGEESNTYYLPGLTWKTSNGWLQIDALSLYTQVAVFNFGAVYLGATASPLSFSTEGSIKREKVTTSAIDVGVTIPLNRKYQPLYLAAGLKYGITYNYDSSIPESDRIDNAIIVTAGIIGLNPFVE